MDNPVTQPTPTQEQFPVAAIVCIAIGGYMVILVALIIIRQVLLQRGMCRENCNWCGKEGEPCCECCLSCAESANCCKSPNITACLDSICPSRKQLSCTDIILCECCSNPDGGCCGSEEPLCDECGKCCQNCWQTQCHCCECNTLDCCCFEISLKGGPQGQGQGPPPPVNGYPNYPYPGHPQDPNQGHGYPPGANPGGYPIPMGALPPTGAQGNPFAAHNVGGGLGGPVAHGRPLPGGAQPGAPGNVSSMFRAQGPAPSLPDRQASAAPF